MLSLSSCSSPERLCETCSHKRVCVCVFVTHAVRIQSRESEFRSTPSTRWPLCLITRRDFARCSAPLCEEMFPQTETFKTCTEHGSLLQTPTLESKMMCVRNALIRFQVLILIHSRTATKCTHMARVQASTFDLIKAGWRD